MRLLYEGSICVMKLRKRMTVSSLIGLIERAEMMAQAPWYGFVSGEDVAESLKSL